MTEQWIDDVMELIQEAIGSAKDVGFYSGSYLSGNSERQKQEELYENIEAIRAKLREVARVPLTDGEIIGAAIANIGTLQKSQTQFAIDLCRFVESAHNIGAK